MLTTVIWITALGFITATAGIIAAIPVIRDKDAKGKYKLNIRGWFFIPCSLLLVILPVALYVIQSKSDKEERDHRDSELRKDYLAVAAKQQKSYDSSVKQIRKDFGDSNNRTLIVIGQTLAKYGLKFDTAARSVLPNQPVLQVITGPDGTQGISFLKFEDGLNHYRINFVSLDGASCCYDLKMTAAVEDSATTDKMRLIYRSPVRMFLTPTDNMSINASQQWTFTIDDSVSYKRLFLWVRGTYGDRDGTHTYHIDQVYFNRKQSNTFGRMGPDFKNKIKELVHRFEKD